MFIDDIVNKALLSHKIKSTAKTVLIQKGIAVNSPGSIVKILNTYYVDVTSEIDQSDILSRKNYVRNK